MKKELYKFFIFYGIASVGLLFGPLFGAKVAAICFTVWLIATGILCSKTLFVSQSPAEIINNTANEIAPRLWKEKKYKQATLTFIAIPLSIVALIMAGMQIIILFFLG